MQATQSNIKDESKELKLEVMKALLTRAADALEDTVTSLSPYRQLIAELRKAAQEAP
jgi:hypothetical protein